MTARDVPDGLGRIGIFDGLFRRGVDTVGAAAIERLEAAGASTLWVPNEAPSLEAVASLLEVGSSRLVVGTAVVSIWSTDPTELATSANRVGGSAPRRFALGIGVSHRPLVESAGATYDEPLHRLERFASELNTRLDPQLVGSTMVGANGPRALTLAGRLTSGAVPYLVTLEQTRRSRSILPADSILAPVIKVIAETDPAKARAIARDRLAFYWTLPNYVRSLRRVGFDDTDFSQGGSDRLIDAICAWGTPEAIAARLHDHELAGADHVAIHLLRTDTDDPSDRWCSVIEAYRPSSGSDYL